MSFGLDTREAGDATIVVLRGELDISSAGRLEDALTALEAGSPALIVVDLRELVFMDSSGLREIVKAHTRAQENGRRVVLVRGPEAVQRVLRITGLEDRLELVDDPSQATASGTPGQVA